MLFAGQSWGDWADQDCSQRVGRLQHTLQWLGIWLHCHPAHSREGIWGHNAGVAAMSAVSAWIRVTIIMVELIHQMYVHKLAVTKLGSHGISMTILQ